MTSGRLSNVILVVAVLVVAAGAAYRFWPQLFPPDQVVAELNPDCDLRAGPCSLVFDGGGQVSFSISPKTIPVMTPLDIEVQLEGLTPDRVEVDFSGTDMYMGYNRVVLNSKENGWYTGQATIPVCVRDAMEWEAKVLVTTAKGIFTAPYRFISVKPGIQ